MRYCFGLQYLNAEEVGDCFVFDLGAIQPNDEKLTLFLDYLIENYIDNEARFPPNVWAEHSSSLQRTTNACESFHSRFNSYFYHTHPHIFQFINTLIDLQSDTYIRIRSANSNLKKIYSAKTIKNKEFLEKQIIKFKNREISRFTFVKSIGHYFHV